MPLIDRVADAVARGGLKILREAGAIYLKYLRSVRKRVEPYVRRYGFLGLVVFVTIPLLATGIWTGALAAYILSMDRGIALALVLGGLISIATTVSVALPVAGLSS